LRCKLKHICSAVDRVDALLEVKIKVKRRIEKLLGDYCWTYEQWVAAHYPDLHPYWARNFVKKLQATRLAWMDDMIAYWKAQGK